LDSLRGDEIGQGVLDQIPPVGEQGPALQLQLSTRSIKNCLS
jgi:hypothetical protein